MKNVILLLLMLPCASASVVISQVLYDPISTESGGEAVELRNDGNEPVDISGWVVRTESSDSDATIPASTVLQPSATFLIADEGWNASKDNAEWKPADYEEKLTLGNTDSGIALLGNGSVVDAVGWGDPANIDDGLYEGDPAEQVSAGMALVRIKDTDDNSADFQQAVPSFLDGLFVPVTASVSFSGSPYLTVSKSLNLSPKGVLNIKNHASTSVDIVLLLEQFRYKENIIDSSYVDIAGGSRFTLAANEERDIEFTLRTPADAVPGTYTAILRVQYRFS